MKPKHYILSLLALLSSVNAFAAVTIGDFDYEFSRDEAKVIFVRWRTTDLYIPSTVTYDGKTYTVTSIANGAFNSTSYLYYTSISFPEEEGQVYNLAGQRLSKPTKGINIQNGRKFIIK